MNITVVGAGIIGCSIAYELASRGAAVRLIDPRGVGCGATQASAGILAPFIEGHSVHLLRLGVRSLAEYEDFLGRIEADSGHRVEFERGGTLHAALDASDAEQLTATARRLGAENVEHLLLGSAEARQLEPALSERVTAALLIPAHGYVAASSLVAAVAQAATMRGAILSTNSAVAIADRSSGADVSTNNGLVPADAVVIAAGSWSSQFVRADPPAVKPIRGQLITLRLGARPAERVVWGSRCYVVPRGDGSILVGATSEDVGFDERATVSAVRDLLAAATELLPVLRDADFEGVRVGLRPMIADELPAIGRSSSMRHVFYATGHYRNGILLAPLTARLIADLVLDDREHPELALVRPGRVGL